MPELDEKAGSAVQYIQRLCGLDIRYGVILGSGLGSVADLVGNPLVIPYNKIPGFPVPTVEGHKGNLVMGRLGGVDVAVMQGRYHYYEGYYMKEVTMPVRVLSGLGVHTLIVTNASGGIRPDLNPGDILSVTDHINMMGVNPLVGMDEKGGFTRYVDMTCAYD
ncbi:MAG TPA: purine-nucleoside phosphorylase, partial [Nitrospirota bacterium]